MSFLDDIISVRPKPVTILEENIIDNGISVTYKNQEGNVYTIDYKYSDPVERTKAQIGVLIRNLLKGKI